MSVLKWVKDKFIFRATTTNGSDAVIISDSNDDNKTIISDDGMVTLRNNNGLYLQISKTYHNIFDERHTWKGTNGSILLLENVSDRKRIGLNVPIVASSTSYFELNNDTFPSFNGARVRFKSLNGRGISLSIYADSSIVRNPHDFDSLNIEKYGNIGINNKETLYLMSIVSLDSTGRVINTVDGINYTCNDYDITEYVAAGDLIYIDGSIRTILSVNSTTSITLTSAVPAFSLTYALSLDLSAKKLIMQRRGYLGLGNNHKPSERLDILGNFKLSGTIKAANLPVYADNSSAITGGLVAGDIYRTSTGELRITI